MRGQNFDDDVDIFDFSKPLETVYLPGGQTEGYVVPQDLDLEPEIKPRPIQGQEYAKAYKERERDQMQKGYYEDEMMQGASSTQGASLGDIEITSAGSFRDVHDLHNEEFTDVYREYYGKKRPKAPTNLMISDFRKSVSDFNGNKFNF